MVDRKGSGMMPIKLALVLSGVAIRGAGHIGAMKALLRCGLTPDVIAGTSAGAMVGALYGSGMPIDRIEEVFLQYQDRRKFLDLDWQSIAKAVLALNPKYFRGLYRGEKITGLVAEHLRHIKEFSDYARPGLPDSVRPVLLSAVNLADGKETIFAPPNILPRGEFRVCTRQSMAFAVHCSITIPGTFVPVACETKPGCPCYGKGRQYYVDGGVRDMYPLIVPLRLAGATHVIGVNLGYAGRQENIWQNGPADYFGHVIEIMGQDQEEADYGDHEVVKAQVVTLNPMIFDVGGFEAQYIPAMIQRGERIMDDFLRSQGLRSQDGRRANLSRLFPPGRRLLRYPAKDSPEFEYWLESPIKGQPAGTVRSHSVLPRKAGGG